MSALLTPRVRSRTFVCNRILTRRVDQSVRLARKQITDAPAELSLNAVAPWLTNEILFNVVLGAADADVAEFLQDILRKHNDCIAIGAITDRQFRK